MACFIKTLTGIKTNRIPIWFMRQAGRYLPEYREIRKDVPDFLSLVYNSDLASEVTLQPLRRFDLDAAILFSDILVIPDALGQHVRFVKGEGPKLNALKVQQEVDQLIFDEEKLLPIMDTIKKTRKTLDQDKALIGFAGAPWTVACYMIDGHGKTDFPKARAIMCDNPDLFEKIITKVTQATIDYLIMQIDAGVNALQLFDSWAGLLSGSDFQHYVINPTVKITSAIKAYAPDIPLIGFPKDSADYLIDYAQQTQVNGIGISQKINIEWAAKTIPENFILQGNLDPNLLLQGGDKMISAAKRICDSLHHRPYIFNLGHGIIKETPIEHVTTLIETIRGME